MVIFSLRYIHATDLTASELTTLSILSIMIFKIKKAKGEFMDAGNGFSYNLDYKTRDSLLKLEINWEDKAMTRRIIRYEPIKIDVLKKLIEMKFINLEEQQNNAPKVQDFYEFLVRYPNVLVYGYVVSPFRKDYRVSIEGMIVNEQDVDKLLMEEFLEFSKTADQIRIDEGLVCWWD